MNPEKTVNKNVRIDVVQADQVNQANQLNITNPQISSPLIGTVCYSQNINKTQGGELVRGYECDPRTVVEEFMLTKKEYDHQTGRDQGDRNIIAYRIRQSFAPGEIEPEKALDVGYELGLRWTKGKHAFIVSVHTDKKHIHCHIDYNSTRIDGSGKFNNFKNSSLALQRLSDIICLEHGLSVIENPQPSKGKNYAKWMKEKHGDKEPSWQDKLRQKIDEVLPVCNSFEDFLALMRTAGYKVNDKSDADPSSKRSLRPGRKHITFLAEGQKKPTRINTLKGDYTEEAIRRRIEEYLAARKSDNSAESPTASGTASGAITTTSASEITTAISTSTAAKTTATTANTHAVYPANNVINGTIKVSWLIDIQAKIQAGKGAGYEHFAHLFNIKEMAKTLMYLKEQGIDNYDELSQKSANASAEFSIVTTNIKTIESRQAEIAELQRQIGTYGKTRDIYNEYKRSGFSQDFYEKNRANIALHEAARKHFDSLGVKKLPKISELKQEFATLQAQKKKLYVSYHELKAQSRELAVAKHNAQKIMDIKLDVSDVKSRDVSRQSDDAVMPKI